MASIHQRPRSKFYYASYRNETGAWALRSTKQTTNKAALNVAMEWEKAGSLARKGELTRAVALRILGEMVETATGEMLDDPTASEFLEEWLAHKKLTKSAGTHARYKPAITNFIKFLGVRAQKTLRGITATDIANFRTKQTEAGKGNSSANLDLKIIRIALQSAHKRGILRTGNPADCVEPLESDEQERQPFAWEQIEKLLGVASKEWRGMILMGAWAGLRINDAASLTWNCIDLQELSLSFSPQKTRQTKRDKKPLKVALHERIVEWLEAQTTSDDPHAPLFPSLCGKKTGSAGGLSNAFRLLMDKANVTAQQTRTHTKESKGRGFTPLSFHSLRHSLVSTLANADVSPDIRKAIAGHTCDRAHSAYTHFDLATQRRALAALPASNAERSSDKGAISANIANS